MKSMLFLFAAAIGSYAAVASSLKVDFTTDEGRVKPLHGVNNAPVRVRPSDTQHELAAAGIPYMRTHDTAGAFGGAHYIDIQNVFPNFDADETDAASYDFALSDAYLKPIVAAGAKIFFRLGTTIEHTWKIKTYTIEPPKDFAKWARICEHIVRHYNEGWANGFKWDIVYWEIWNEPENPPMWKGTREQFFELYCVSANHLKRCFPAIKVGGYAGCGFYAVDDKGYKMRHNAFYQGFVTWFEDFCRYVTAEQTKAPLDFFSWHLYLYGNTPPERIGVHADYVRKTLDGAGLTATESIFDEWNWNPSSDWMRVKGHEGAAVMTSAFAVMQRKPIDIAMYYDALPTRGHGGFFFFPNIEPTPTYYAFMAFNELYSLGSSVACSVEGDGLYVLAAKGGDDRAVLLANIGNSDAELTPTIVGGPRGYRRYRIAKGDRELEEAGYCRVTDKISLPAHSVLLLTTRQVDVAAARHKDTGKKSINGLEDGAPAFDPLAPKRLEVRDVGAAVITTNAARNAVVDFGCTAFGWLELVGDGPYSIVLGEMTNAEGRVTNPSPGSLIRAQSLSGEVPGCRYRVPMPPDSLNLRGYNPKAPAILLPKELGIVYPFRFAEIIEAPCAAEKIVQRAVNYPIDMTKSFLESDNADLVSLYEFCKRTIRSTSFCGIYVDGDRERTPYEADAYINQLCHYAIDDDCSLARRSHEWLMAHPTWPTEWKQHSIMMAWADWMWSGDTKSLANCYDSLKDNKLDAGGTPRADGLLVTDWRRPRTSRDIVDWPECERDDFDFTEINAVVNAFRYRNLREMSDIARILDEPDDAKRFSYEAERVKAAFDRAFYRSASGLYADGEKSDHTSLHANAAALAFGLVPPERQSKVADFLESKGMACSVYFAQYYLEALYAAGRDETAMRLMLSHGDRSWLGMMDFGLSLTMEAWNLKVKPNLDLNHAWGAVPLNIISRYVLGVTPSAPGFAKISICPRVGGIRNLKGKVPTISGPVTVEISGETLSVDVPSPTTITWRGQTHEVAPGAHQFK